MNLLYEEIDKLNKKIKILELKNKSSLANNLCPDHRDKQTGKICLACEIEHLTNFLMEIESGNGQEPLSESLARKALRR